MAKTEEVKKLNILDVAQQLGMSFKRVGHGSYAWEEHDSFIISTSKNIYSWFSKDKHGDVIDLVRTVKEYQTGQPVSFKEAKRYLETGEFEQANIIEQPRPTFSYYLGQYETQDMTKARDYLRQERGLSDETIDHFIDQGLLAQATKKTGSVYEPVIVFKTLNKAGEVTGASLQGIVENRELHDRGRLKQLMRASDGLSGMTLDIGQPKRLVFAESPIDLMSYYQLHKDRLADVRLVAMDGLKEGTISRHFAELWAEREGTTYMVDRRDTPKLLEKTAKVTTILRDEANKNLITLAIDNDEAGRRFVAKLQDKGIPVVPAFPPLKEGQEKMDWNDYLKQKGQKIMTETTKKSQEQAQGIENERTNGGLGSLQQEAEGSPAPVTETVTFERSVTSRPTLSSPLLEFSISNPDLSSHKKGYHAISETELRKLNRSAWAVQRAASWYRETVANSELSYFVKDGDEIKAINLTFREDNFLHLTALFPVKEGQTASKSLHDFADGNGNFDQLLIKNDDSTFDKIRVLPELEMITNTSSFYFDNLLDIQRYGRMNTDRAIRTNDQDLLLAFRTTDEGSFPASLFKLKKSLNIELDNKETEKIILGVYRNRDGVIDQLSINEDYIKDGGAEMMAIMENHLFEKEQTQEEVLQEESQIGNLELESPRDRMTRVLDTTRELGRSIFTPEKEKEFSAELAEIDQLLDKYEGDLDLVITDLTLRGLVDTESDFYRNWVDDMVYEHQGVGWTDALNGKISQEDFSNFVTKTLTALEDKVVNQDKEGPVQSSPEQSSVEPLETEEVVEASPQKVKELIANKDTRGLSDYMKAGIKTYLNSDQYKEFLTAMSRLPNYSANNLMLLKAQKPNVQAVASFKVWKEKFGRMVNKGEQALRIWAPVIITKKDKETGQPILDDKGKPETYTTFKLVPVFDVSQTNGKDLPKAVNQLEGRYEDYAKLYRATKQLANENGVAVEVSAINSPANGYYVPDTSKIVIKQGMSETQTLKTFFHELAHSYLHNKEAMANKSYSRSEKELQAESVAFVMASHYGIDTSSYSFGYLANWSRDKEALSDFEAQLNIVQKSAQELIQRLDNILETQQEKTRPMTKLDEKIAQAKTKSVTKPKEQAVIDQPKKLESQAEHKTL